MLVSGMVYISFSKPMKSLGPTNRKVGDVRILSNLSMTNSCIPYTLHFCNKNRCWRPCRSCRWSCHIWLPQKRCWWIDAMIFPWFATDLIGIFWYIIICWNALLLMAEIRRSPVEVGSWNPIVYIGFHTSQVVQDFSHQFVIPSKLKKNRFRQKEWPDTFAGIKCSHVEKIMVNEWSCSPGSSRWVFAQMSWIMIIICWCTYCSFGKQSQLSSLHTRCCHRNE